MEQQNDFIKLSFKIGDSSRSLEYRPDEGTGVRDIEQSIDDIADRAKELLIEELTEEKRKLLDRAHNAIFNLAASTDWSLNYKIADRLLELQQDLYKTSKENYELKYNSKTDPNCGLCN